MRAALLAPLVLLAACAGAPEGRVEAQAPAATPGLALANAGFEQSGAPGACPPGWSCVSHAGAKSHAYRIETRDAAGGRQSLCTDALDRVNWALLYQMVPAGKLAGARLRLSAAIRIAKDGGTGAGPFLLVQGGDGGTLAHDQKLVPDTAGWKRLTAEVVVPPGAHQLQVGVLFETHATACADDLRLEILAPAPGAV